MRSFAGMLGVIAFIAAIVVGTLAVTGILSDAATSAGVGGSRVSKDTDHESVTRTLEEPVIAGDLSWTVSEARRTSELHTYTYPKSSIRGDFITIAFTARNTSDGPITLSDKEMALRDKETGTVGGPLAGGPAASVNGEYVPPTRNPLFTEEGLLDPGEEVEGRVNFDLNIPFGEDPTTDLTGFELILGDGDPTAEEEKSVDLGL